MFGRIYRPQPSCKLVVRAGTCSGAHAPRGQPVGRGEAVEHADVLRSEKLHEIGVVEHLPLAVQDGRSLVRDVNDLSRDERDGYGKYILKGTETS